MTTEERFWAKVDKGTDPNGCWLWTAARQPAGYGKFAVRRRAQVASRVSWEMAYGPIPDGLFALHRCDNPPCVRPDHLFLGTAADNTADKIAKGRHRTGSFPGVLNPKAKLTPALVREVRARHRAGESCYRLARIYGVCHSAVVRLVQRVTWRHVQDAA